MENYLVKIYCVRHSRCECTPECRLTTRLAYLFSYFCTSENSIVAARDVKDHFDKTTTGWAETFDRVVVDRLERIHVIDFGRQI